MVGDGSEGIARFGYWTATRASHGGRYGNEDVNKSKEEYKECLDTGRPLGPKRGAAPCPNVARPAKGSVLLLQAYEAEE